MRPLSFAAVLLFIGVLTNRAVAETTPSADDLKSQLTKTVVVDGWASRHYLNEYRGDNTRAIVCVFMTTECPLVKLYMPTLIELEKKFRPQGVQFLGIFSNTYETLPMINAYAEEMDIPFPVLKDEKGLLAERLGAERTPEVVVLDPDFNIRYKGLIDDQYRAGGKLPNVNREHLRLAVEQMLAGEDVEVAATLATGCQIERYQPRKPRTDLTYNRDIAPLIRAHCQTCHRPGQVGPFELLTYENVRRHVAMIEEVVTDRRMPPWYAYTDTKQFGHFVNDRRMSYHDVNTLVDWIRSGAAEGDPQDAGPNPEWPEGWQIGKPDLILEMQEEYDVPADGVINYKYFKVRPYLDEDRWVKAVEIQPGNHSVVHHITVHFAPPRRKALFGKFAVWTLYGKEGERAHVVGSYAPGAPPIEYPAGHAMKLPRGCDIYFEVHYTPIGIPQKDRSRIGIVFADEPPQHEIKEAWVIERGFDIPAGEPHYRVGNSYTFEKDSKIMSLRPHMHLRGKSWRFTLVEPDGKESLLMALPRWDYDWQDLYEFEKPIDVPAGTTIRCVAHWDNSIHNPNNPDASHNVQWGLNSEDEMMHWRVIYVENEP